VTGEWQVSNSGGVRTLWPVAVGGLIVVKHWFGRPMVVVPAMADPDML
jgi:hypothetical protein